MLHCKLQKDSENLEGIFGKTVFDVETYGDDKETRVKNASVTEKEEVEKLLKQCTCFIFVANPRSVILTYCVFTYRRTYLPISRIKSTISV